MSLIILIEFRSIIAMPTYAVSFTLIRSSFQLNLSSYLWTSYSSLRRAKAWYIIVSSFLWSHSGEKCILLCRRLLLIISMAPGVQWDFL